MLSPNELFTFISSDDRGFYQTLKVQVDRYFQETGQSRYANQRMVCKIVFYFAAFFSLYVAILLGGFNGLVTLALAILCGWVNVLIAFNIGHDAAHDAISHHKKVNRLLGILSLNLIGGNAYIYGIVHNTPHFFPNVPGVDVTLDQTGMLLRLSPTMPLRPFHRYQHLYGPMLYLLYSIFLVFLKDFRIFRRPRIGNKLIKGHPIREYVVLILCKLMYGAYAIILPLYALDFPWWQVLAGFCCMHLGMGLLITLVLQPVHLSSDLTFEESDADGVIHKHWALYQMEATKDFAPESRLANFLLGGLNTHVIHHLFPRICHVHYLPLTRLLRETAAACGVPYHSQSFLKAILGHWKFLRLMGRQRKPGDVASEEGRHGEEWLLPAPELHNG